MPAVGFRNIACGLNVLGYQRCVLVDPGRITRLDHAGQAPMQLSTIRP